MVHKATRAFVSDPDKSLFVVEDLKVKNMTKSPDPKKDESGNYVKNGARAKAGLNKAILSFGWGLFVVLLSYKARKAGKLVIKVPPHYSSQECARCGHVHPDNRPSRAAFVCQRCGLTDNADDNASRVIARRGIRLLLEGAIRKKEVRRCGIGKPKQPGPERSEVKASGEENKTQRPKRLRASSTKEEPSARESGNPHYRVSLVAGEFIRDSNLFSHFGLFGRTSKGDEYWHLEPTGAYFDSGAHGIKFDDGTGIKI